MTFRPREIPKLINQARAVPPKGDAAAGDDDHYCHMITPISPLRGWPLEFARRWNAHTHSVFLLHGNIHDVFPTREGYAPLKSFLMRRLLPEGRLMLFYDIGDGLSFGSPEMQKRFYEWLQIF